MHAIVYHSVTLLWKMTLTATVILWASWQIQGHDLFPSVLPVCVLPSYPFVTRKGWEGHFYARECPAREDQVDPCRGQVAVPMVSSRTVLKCFSKKAEEGVFYRMTITKADANKLEGVTIQGTVQKIVLCSSILVHVIIQFPY